MIRSPRSLARISDWSLLNRRERSTSTTGLWRLTLDERALGDEVDGGRGAWRVRDAHLVAEVDRDAEQGGRRGAGGPSGLHDGLDRRGALVELADLRAGAGGHEPRRG